MESKKIKYLFYQLMLHTGNKAKAATSSTGPSDKLYSPENDYMAHHITLFYQLAAVLSI